MTSPVMAAAQFQVLAGRISNLDRCNRCGSQRAAHGADWTCPQRLSSSAARIMLIIGGVLAVAGGTASAAAGPALNTLAALALPAGIILLVSSWLFTEDHR
jgi:hypothetical protein